MTTERPSDGQWAKAWARVYGHRSSAMPFHEEIAPMLSDARGDSDVRAAWQRWHDQSQADDYESNELLWYCLLERARVEILAARDLPGMGRNLADPTLLAPSKPAMSNIYLAARQALLGQDVTEPIVLPKKQERHWIPMGQILLMGVLRFLGSAGDGAKTTDRLTDAEVKQSLLNLKSHLKDAASFAQESRELAKKLAQHYTSMEEGPHQQPAKQAVTPDASAASLEDKNGQDEVVSESMPGQSELSDLRHFGHYRVYNASLDEVMPAAHWLDSKDRMAFKELNSLNQSQVRRLARRLQRQLQAAQLRRWSFDQELGLLDSRRLAKLVTGGGNRNIFKIEGNSPVPEACVTFLVDQSGSMRGERQRITALAIDLAVSSLELCGMRCEVLGFTTRFGADNPLSLHWQQAMPPMGPGRLNALRHVIYKTPQQPWRRVRQQLGLLLRPGFGHENIDGESLYWAARRLLHHPQPRKVLVVLSDGVPYDQETARANGRDYLENHLRAVIDQIESMPIELVAIGAGSQVGRFYRKAFAIKDPSRVGEVMLASLGHLLSQPFLNEALT